MTKKTKKNEIIVSPCKLPQKYHAHNTLSSDLGITQSHCVLTLFDKTSNIGNKVPT